eukprot:1160293-Pelagomonas_calceolata.AAC.7
MRSPAPQTGSLSSIPLHPPARAYTHPLTLAPTRTPTHQHPSANAIHSHTQSLPLHLFAVVLHGLIHSVCAHGSWFCTHTLRVSPCAFLL